MLRSSTNANSPYVMVALTGHAGVVFQYRATAGAAATVNTASPGPLVNYPYWLKLNKNSSNVITASISPDSLVWTQVGQATVSLGTTFLAGIANTSTNAALLNNAAVNKVSLTNFNTLAIDNIELYAAIKEKHKVDLSWAFATNERDNSFTIERSSNGISFSPILHRSYVNNSNILQTVNDVFTDETPFSGNNYYRLKTIQKDGQARYSNIQHITIIANVVVKLEPNPVLRNNELKIMISGAPLTKMIFNIYDFTGKKIQSEIFTNSGSNRIYLNNISAGAYFYKLMYDGQVETGKLIVSDK